MSDTQMPWLNIFIDESGSSDDDRLFSCVAVLVDDAALDSAREAVEALALEQASGGEIKSKSIGDNHARRLRFLEAIQSIEFQYACLVVDKRAIRADSGLRFSKSFNKFFKRLLQRPLETYSSGGIRAVFDNYGWPNTMSEFERYMDDRMPPSLFFDYQPSHVDSRDERLVQLADLIAGSINWCFDPGRRCPESRAFRELLVKKELSITAWPPRDYVAPAAGTASEDASIAREAQARVQQLITRYESSELESERALSIMLEQLLFCRLFEDESRQSVYADQFPAVLAQEGVEMSVRQVRGLIGSIRDQGVVVAGSPSGYKLALTVSDVDEYLAHTEGIVGPMLTRVRRARESVKLDTPSRYDILERRDSLRLIVQALGDASLVALENDQACEEAEAMLESES